MLFSNGTFFPVLRLFLLVAILSLDAKTALSASAVSQSKQIVYAPTGLLKISDLDFGMALAGTPRKRVAPGSSENPENASFLASGSAGATFTIILPTTNILLTNPGSSDQLIVRRFRSRPKNSGRIRANGTRMIYVGATRRPIAAGVAPGLYTGTFTVQIVY